jgi:hypothetical protein
VKRGINSFTPQDTVATDLAGNLIEVGSQFSQSPNPPDPGVSGLFAAKYAAGTGAELWRVATTGSPAGDFLAAVAIDAAGDLYVTGAVNDDLGKHQYVAKISGASGAVIWQSIGAPGQSTTHATTNFGIDVAIDPAGNPIVMGTLEGMAIVTRYAAGDGATVWSSQPAYDSLATQYPVSLRLDPSGNALGVTFVSGGSNSVLFKLDGASGSRLWATPLASRINVPGTPDIKGFTLDGAGKPIVVGSEIAKYSNVDGTLTWSRALGQPGTTSRVFGVVTAGNGDVIVTGAIDAFLNTARLESASGNTLWISTFPGTDSGRPSEGKAVALDALGGLLVAATLYEEGSIDARFGTLKYNSITGAFIWTQRHAENGGASASVVLAPPGGVYTIGVAFHPSGPVTTEHIIRYADGMTAGNAKSKVDFNGDGMADLVFENPDQSFDIRLMQGTGMHQSQRYSPIAGGRLLDITGDFNGDGKTDLLFQHDDGAVEMWLMDGVSILDSATIMSAGTGWTITHVADFNNDGKSDLQWTHADGAAGAWLMNGLVTLDRGPVMASNTGWSVAHVADFNGDGRADFIWVHRDGSTSMWLMDGRTVLDRGPLMGPGTGWRVSHVADFNGDGNSDLIWTHSDGSVGMWLMNGRTLVSRASQMGTGTGWAVAHVADFNGDGKADLLWRSGDGAVGMWLMNGTGLLERRNVMAGGMGWMPSLAPDLSGDGKADLAWSHADGAAGAWLMNGTTVLERRPLQPSGSLGRLRRLQFER